ncbi:cyanase [Streptomyces sp. NPDC005811]|uniref:cyanase n=1 Tax=Streptomyces sp. NPDC005811 TaxID=3154565 RepID=UPI0033EB495A
MISKQEAGALIDQRRRERGLSWRELAEMIERPAVWLVAAVLGMHPVPRAEALLLQDEFGLDEPLVDALVRQPMRIPREDVSSDPTIYRFHELIQVYGPALKALIHDEFGDGIMSAINCSIDLQRKAHADGDRVVITIDGKYLPYAWVQSSSGPDDA